MSSTLSFSRTLSVKPDEESRRVTLAALKALVLQAETLGFTADSEVYVMPVFSSPDSFAISITDGA